MKKACLLLLLLLVACDPPPPPPPAPQMVLPADVQAHIDQLKIEQREVAGEVAKLRQELAGLEQERTNLKGILGKSRYMLKLQLKQSHFSLDIGDHVKDSMNKAEFWIPVDKEMYDSVSNGSEILDKFRVGSLIMNGSFGSWHIKVLEKKMVEK